ncbi:2-hydroxy-3-oxopropionate reductase [Reticulomyxa filosa]|uniref:2-hydroxy-3-oxopropionate reductase n=1 Tax=Reticulomyxa filosa TaxID=46433 RepID=X6LLW5_RETFI|nr:2-hydroxy-3-oxopropionate reductase [Reticulomyxa filosa]|eukprot:ETO02142.1 2-hydroxy-3-oxopropionate reductase [Reticulomyxa filosa]
MNGFILLSLFLLDKLVSVYSNPERITSSPQIKDFKILHCNQKDLKVGWIGTGKGVFATQNITPIQIHLFVKSSQQKISKKVEQTKQINIKNRNNDNKRRRNDKYEKISIKQTTIFNRTRSKCEPLEKLGAKFAESPMHVAQQSDVIFSIVGYPKDVRETILGKKGTLAGAKAGSIIVDMTTSEVLKVSNSKKESSHNQSHFHSVTCQYCVHAIPIAQFGRRNCNRSKQEECQITRGGDVGAKNATLSIMVGGDKDALDKVHGLFQHMGKTIQYMGSAGRGQHTKMVNQILIASNMVGDCFDCIDFFFYGTHSNKHTKLNIKYTIVLNVYLQIGVCEGLLYAHKVGLNLEEVIKAVFIVYVCCNFFHCYVFVGGGGAASFSINVLGHRIVKGDFNPGFFVEHFIKDMGIALEESKRMNLSLPGLALAQQLYIALQAQGHGRKGTQALILALESLSGGQNFAAMEKQFNKLYAQSFNTFLPKKIFLDYTELFFFGNMAQLQFFIYSDWPKGN